MVLFLAREFSGLTLKALGELAGGLKYGAVNMALYRFRQKIKTDQSVADVVDRAVAKLKGSKALYKARPSPAMKQGHSPPR